MGLTDTAYHEAGHVVADFVLGIRIDRVSIIPDEDTLGHVRNNAPFRRSDVAEFDISPRDRRRLENRIIGLYTGEVSAARAKEREPDLSAVGNTSDLRQIGSLGHLGRGLYDLHPDEQAAYLELLFVRARLLVDDYWFLINPLAAELLTTRALSGRAVYRLLRSVVQTEAERLMPEAFVPSTVSIGDNAVTGPPLIEPSSMTAYGWRVVAQQVAVMSRPESWGQPRESARARTKKA
jgi:hypothetical protein